MSTDLHPPPTILNSFFDYGRRMGHWGWLVITCWLLGDVVTFGLFIWGAWHAPLPEGIAGSSIWLLLLFLANVLFFLPFFAFHALRLEHYGELTAIRSELQTIRDEASRKSMLSLEGISAGYGILSQFDRDSEAPPQFWIQFGVTVRNASPKFPLNYRIANFAISADGRTYQQGAVQFFPLVVGGVGDYVLGQNYYSGMSPDSEFRGKMRVVVEYDSEPPSRIRLRKWSLSVVIAPRHSDGRRYPVTFEVEEDSEDYSH